MKIEDSLAVSKPRAGKQQCRRREPADFPTNDGGSDKPSKSFERRERRTNLPMLVHGALAGGVMFFMEGFAAYAASSIPPWHFPFEAALIAARLPTRGRQFACRPPPGISVVRILISRLAYRRRERVTTTSVPGRWNR